MATMINTGSDVVTFLKDQHREIKQRFSEVIASQGAERKTAFDALRRLLAVHETAEEEIVHPAARRALKGGELIVTARLQEEKEAKQMLSDLEDMDVESPDFDTNFLRLQKSVLMHAQFEEEQEFEPLADLLDEDRLDRMRRAAEFAERIAPTHPHPGVESAAANILVGPFAAMVDRMRDAFAGAR